jgi:hypothetical protein
MTRPAAASHAFSFVRLGKRRNDSNAAHHETAQSNRYVVLLGSQTERRSDRELLIYLFAIAGVALVV